MADQDHYKVLGLTRNANADEIKQAFRKLAVQFHPDKHSHSSKSVRDNATLNFKRISQAYQILSDHRKRAHYDTISSNPFHRQPNSSCPRYGYGQSQKNYTYSTVHSFSLFDAALRYFTTRAFLLHCTFARYLISLFVLCVRASTVVVYSNFPFWSVQRFSWWNICD